MTERYTSRKFGLAVAFTVATIAGLFLDKLDGGTFVASASLILGLYAAADVAQDQLSKRAG